MKKTLLLSVVASTLIMAGGDIEPVAVPVVEEVVSGWDFSGQAVVYYQTGDWNGGSLFDQAESRANAGLQLRAVNKDVFWGIGAGADVSGLATLGLENDVVGNIMQGAGDEDFGRGGWISQAYLTYGFGNTSLKAGRQELPKGLSPFAFSEGWNVFKNTFDSLLVVNTDITDTTIVGAWVEGANHNNVYGAPTGNIPMIASAIADGGRAPLLGGNMADFSKVNGGAGIYMLTLQNKSVQDLTLTGTYYYAADYLDNIAGLATGNDAHILWGDAKYNFNTNGIVLGLQGGTVMDDDFSDDTTAFGAKIGGNFDMFSASLAYSTVNDGGVGVFNVGGVKTPLYTQLILNQDFIRFDNDTIVAKAGLKALGGKFGLAYNYTNADTLDIDYTEVDVTYKTKVFNDSTTLFAGYVYQDLDGWTDSRNLIRVWGRYNF